MRKTYAFFIFLLLCIWQAVAGEPVRILAIGNSFSEDAVEQYLHEIADAAGFETIIANMYIPGCPLKKHAGNIATDSAAYRYRKIGVDGHRHQQDKKSIHQALTDEAWDYVSVQQVSHFSGLYDTYQPYLSQLIAYIRARVPETTKILFHQTWAYAQDSKHDGFRNYNRDQDEMFQAIIKTVKQVRTVRGIDQVIPAGTAIQNARNSSLGDSLTRDGYHLQLTYGRYTVACTWFESIFRRSVIGNTYTPEQVSDSQKSIAQVAAHQAVRRPWKVSAKAMRKY